MNEGYSPHKSGTLEVKKAFFLSQVLNAPFWAMCKLLPFILFRDLDASAFQISLLIALQPIVSLISPYWSAHIHDKRGKLRSNIIGSTLLAHAPFFFFPFVSNAWFIVFSVAFNTMMERGGKPAWMEVLKLTLLPEERQRLFSRVSTCSYLGCGLIPLGLAFWMDQGFEVWRWIFPMLSALSLLAIFWQIKIELPSSPETEEKKPKEQLLLKPWKDAWNLLNQRKDFLFFQVGFFLCGAGVMMMQPAFPAFFIGELNLSYAELTFAITLCKGIGFALTSPFWARLMSQVNIFRLVSWICLFSASVPLFLIGAKGLIVCVYIAYLLYGAMQGGSELIWNLSGPLFASREDSSKYTSVNVLMVGIRGCIAPFLGGWLTGHISPVVPLIMGGLLSLTAAWQMGYYSKLARSETAVRN